MTQENKRRIFMGVLALGLVLTPKSLLGSSVLFGDLNSPSVWEVPWTEYGTDPVEGRRFQQLYSKEVFAAQDVSGGETYAGTFDIRGIMFPLYDDSGVFPPGATYTVTLYHTNRNPTQLDEDYEANYNPNPYLTRQVFRGTLANPVAGQQYLTFWLDTPFYYDYSSANLLIDIQQTGGISSPATIFTRAFADAGTASVVENFYINTSRHNDGSGLVTMFVSTPREIPEPGTLALFAGGLGLLGWSTWRKRRSA